MDNLHDKNLKDFRVSARDAITFKLIRTKTDFDVAQEFHPEYTHQIFGESEQIFGYSNLKVNIWYLAGSLSTYIAVKYSTSVDPKVSKGVLPDDIYKLLSETFPYKYDRSLVDFSRTFQNDSFSPYGTVRHTYHRSKDKRKFSVYYIEYGMPDFEIFLNYHKRMESLLLFFVDGASAISTEDTQWCYYTLFEIIESSDSAALKFAFVGYMTVYKFYAYPASIRPRLSQVLVLPPFRNSGHASELLMTFYHDFVHVPNVRDITVEDPSDDFRRLRDFLDCKRCLEQDEIMDLLKCGRKNGNPALSKDTSHKSTYLLFRNKAQQLLKINRCQAKRIYEILCLYLLPRTPEAMVSFRNALLRRTVADYKRARAEAIGDRSEDRRDVGASSVPPGPLRVMCNELADECFESQVNEHVNADLLSYQTVVVKLDYMSTRTS
ncbi:Histone acetyltransferase type B catalytic subunit [Paragonimus heterotremus]|uniref:histone acetyltransferase n=1 Tax=Paragonimus heterotremus TaxID=100268 RepID=A0A8J4SUC3_9TREM|nr:Histone acetyltransferase type B catalytic subunit [Paragonimus heterotremus]